VLDQIHEINALLVLTAIRDLDVIGFVHFVEHVLSNVILVFGILVRKSRFPAL